ncbi:hypothetical protein Pden_1203 [Paracoccus denitrificans PD1222]|uniref:Uncharacterized protein n=1 Tax=Paracoccus denitrificans (strain Pd 1222) TaxID=318586 RepID=A1B1B4_PARDP|nr:hypothetical protein Pden_1203 [Paracoccus denitrificans PD1222]
MPGRRWWRPSRGSRGNARRSAPETLPPATGPELGKDALRYHRGLAAQILKIRPDEVLLCGPLMQELWDELSKSGAGRVDGAHYPRGGGFAFKSRRPSAVGGHRSSQSVELRRPWAYHGPVCQTRLA